MRAKQFWVPYHVRDQKRPFIVVGPFAYRDQAVFASETMKRAATQEECVGVVVEAFTEEEALSFAPACCGVHIRRGYAV
jgi:hypothetical protein